MRRHREITLFLAILSAFPVFAQNLTPAALAARAKAQNVPEIAYESVPNLLKFPANLYLGEGIGVATNSKGHIFVYTRSQRTRLFEFDQKGSLRPRDRRGPLWLCVRSRGAGGLAG